MVLAAANEEGVAVYILMWVCTVLTEVGVYRRSVWVCTVGRRGCWILVEGRVAVGVYSISGKNEWVCTLLAEEGMAVGVYSISSRGSWGCVLY